MSNFPMRDYDQAVQRLNSLQRYFDTKGRLERLGQLRISVTGTGQPTPPHEFTEGLEKLIRDDLQKFGAMLIHKAQDDVRKAAAVLRAEIDANLKSSAMQD